MHIIAAARDIYKASDVFSEYKLDERFSISKCDLSNIKDVNSIVESADALIWCASGFTDSSNWVDKIKGILTLKFAPTKIIDIASLSDIGQLMKVKSGVVSNGPQVVMCSSAGLFFYFKSFIVLSHITQTRSKSTITCSTRIISLLTIPHYVLSTHALF